MIAAAARPRDKVLVIAALCATGVLGVGIAEAAVRDQALLSTAAVVLGAGLFFAVLLVQLVKPRSVRLACSLAVVAIAVYVLFPAVFLLSGTSPDFPAINIFSIVALHSFTYSVRGIAAALASLAFVLLLVRSGVVHRPRFGADNEPEPERTVSARAADSSDETQPPLR